MTGHEVIYAMIDHLRWNVTVCIANKWDILVFAEAKELARWGFATNPELREQ